MEIVELNPKNPSSSSSTSCDDQEQMNSSKKAETEINNSKLSLFTCEICIEPVPLNQKFKNQCSSDDHPFCTDCVAKYIQVQVEDGHSDEIKCPDANCNVYFDALSCRSILAPKVFEKWCDLLCESAVLQNSSEGGFAYGRAYCPLRDCSELVVNECERSSRITKSNCPNCKNLFCFHCMVPWRENHHQCRTNRNGMTADVDRNDVLFVDMVKRKKWTRCPTCNRYVERSRGCIIITCRCKTKFCYLCGDKWESCVCKTGRIAVRRCVLICCCLFITPLIFAMLCLFIALPADS